MRDKPPNTKTQSNVGLFSVWVATFLAIALILSFWMDADTIRSFSALQSALKPFEFDFILVGNWSIFLILCLAVASIWQKKDSDRVSVGSELFFALLLSLFTSQALHLLWPRPRPFFLIGLEPLFSHNADASFPSDHLTAAAAIGFSLILNGSRLGWAILSITALSAVARTMALLHWPSDVVAGSALGFFGALASYKIDEFIKKRRGPAGWRTFFAREENLALLIAYFRYMAILYAFSEISYYIKASEVRENKIQFIELNRLLPWTPLLLLLALVSAIIFTLRTNNTAFNATLEASQFQGKIIAKRKYIRLAIVGDFLFYVFFYVLSRRVESHMFVFFLIPIVASSLLSSFSGVLKTFVLSLIALGASISIISFLYEPVHSKQWLILFLFGPRALSALLVSIPLAFIVHIRAQQQSLLDNLPLMITRKNLNGVITYAGEKFCALNGMSKDYLEGKTDFDLYDPKTASAFRADDKAAIASSQPIPIDEYHTPKNGNAIPVKGFKVAVRDSVGRPVEVQVVFWDVTKEKRQEEEVKIQAAELRQQACLMHALMDNLPDSVYFKDTESNFTRISKHLANKFKLEDPNEARGKSDSDFFDSIHSNEARALEQKILETGVAVEGFFEKEIYRDGTVNYVISSKMPLRDSISGQVIGTFGISIDVRDYWQWQAHEGAIVEHAGELIYARELNGRLVQMNSMGCRLLGYSEEEIKQLTIVDIVHPDQKDEVRRKLFDGTLNTGSKLQRWKIVNRDRQEILMEFTTCDIKSSQGNELIVGFGRDVTAVKKREDDLQWRSDMWREAAAAVTHKISTTLAPAQYKLQMLRRMLDAQDPRHMAEVAYDSVSLTLDIAGNFRRHLIQEPIEVNEYRIDELSYELVRYCQNNWGEYRHDFKVNVPDDISIRASLASLKIVLGTFFADSISFHPEGKPNIDLHLTLQKQNLCLVYQDDGPGIPSAIKAKIFEPFFTTRKKGTGMGLRIVQEIVLLHNGTIQEIGAKNTGLGGVCFVICIPTSTR